MKKICVITGTRAEYGLLRQVLFGVNSSSVLKLQLVVTGMHLSSEYGFTIQEIEADGFRVDKKVEMVPSSDSAVELTKCMGEGLIRFSDVLSELRPDLLLVLGDRYEIFIAVIAAMISGTPIAHLHGGEVTQGAFDEAMRHSITKMAHLHFVAASEYEKRVIQLGEQPESVYKVGGLGVDSIMQQELLTLQELEGLMGFKFHSRNFLITYHPETIGNNGCGHIDELLAALDELVDTGLIFTLPNSDPGGRIISKRIQAFCATRAHACAYSSLGQMKYLSCMKYVDGVIGNSSSGILEAPTFKKGSINIGDRQLGRLRASSIIDCEPTRQSIASSIHRLYSKQFQEMLEKVENPYGRGGASKAIIEILEKVDFQKLIKKSFYNLESLG